MTLDIHAHYYIKVPQRQCERSWL